jgi:hypothetical protein
VSGPDKSKRSQQGLAWSQPKSAAHAQLVDVCRTVCALAYCCAGVCSTRSTDRHVPSELLSPTVCRAMACMSSMRSVGLRVLTQRSTCRPASAILVNRGTARAQPRCCDHCIRSLHHSRAVLQAAEGTGAGSTHGSGGSTENSAVDDIPRQQALLLWQLEEMGEDFLTLFHDVCMHAL